MSWGTCDCPLPVLLTQSGKGSAFVGAGPGCRGRAVPFQVPVCSHRGLGSNSHHGGLTHLLGICPIFKDPLKSHFDRSPEPGLSTAPNQDVNNRIDAAVDRGQQQADLKDKINVDKEVEEDLDTEWDAEEEEEENSEEDDSVQPR